MRRLAWITSGLAPVLVACTQPNPAFDEDCLRPTDCLADGSGTSSEAGDGDPGDGDPGDGDPSTGDGDGDPSTGDGDGDPTTGDGDGDPTTPLPACPDGAEFSLPLVEDTFLDGSGSGGNECLISYDYNTQMYAFAQLPCAGLDFGGLDMHWVCNSQYCNSTWLGRFDVLGFADDPGLTVKTAQFVFTAKIWSNVGIDVELFELDVDSLVYEDCLDWMAGDSWGQSPAACVTTFIDAAHPYPWNNLMPIEQLDPNSALASKSTPTSPDGPDYRMWSMPVEISLVQDWMRGNTELQGVLLRSNSFEPIDFNLLAQGSENPPQLIVTLCSEAP